MSTLAHLSRSLSFAKKVTLNLLVTSHYNYVNNHFMAAKMLFVVLNLAQFLY